MLPFGTTTYKNEYCNIAEQRLNMNGKSDGPIDMYTKIKN